ncbi:hypothetical protein Q8F55_004991 [Vanrija albida]|uniref:Glycosyl transferase CAP10 domain-containing protein n=1 Tax=Vanrija albida TaxID=181172 RepID=A0ABR3Q0G8_9TREE
MRLSHTRTRSRADSASRPAAARQRGASVSSAAGSGVYAALVGDEGDDAEPASPNPNPKAAKPRAMSPIARKLHAHARRPSGTRRFLTAPRRPPPTTTTCAPRLRALRPRRLLLLLALAGLLLLVHLLHAHDDPAAAALSWLTPKPPPCAFVSPVEAYFADLARLRGHANASAAASLRSAAAQHRHSHHVFSSTGHMVLSRDEAAPHPIPLLLALGERRWEELLARQSRSLAEAVAEYERRYGRAPPRGFDRWWAFASENNLVLPDEYDRINLDLAPFWALPRAEVRRRLDKVMRMNEVFVLEVKGGRVRPRIEDKGGLAWAGTWPRAKAAVKLIRPFAHHLPDLNATFSIFDQPQIYLSWGRRSSLASLGLKGQHTSLLEENDDPNVELARSCAPDSALRTNPAADEGKSFIYNSLEAGDFCQNPYLVPLHGLTLEAHTPESHPRPHSQLLPLFSLAKTSVNSDILVTPLDQFNDRTGRDPVWEKKSDARLVWRGSPTGMAEMTRDVPWRQSHRVRLHHFANNHSLALTSFMVPDLGEGHGDKGDAHANGHYGQLRQDVPPLGYRTENGTTWGVGNYFFDMALAGGAIQCDEDDGTCDDMEREIDFAPFQRSPAMNKHKFLLDIDGNGWSGRFRRLMSTNSVVIKTGIFSEWFQPHLIPWFMYIPSKLDFSDLADILAFFRGSPKQRDLMFDGTAKALGHNGKCFVERMFRIEDLQAYMFRLFLEYARIVADDDEDMDFHYDPTLHDPVDQGDVSGEGDNADDEDDDSERVRAPFLGAEDVLGGGVHLPHDATSTTSEHSHSAPSRTPRPFGLNGKVTTTSNTPPGEGGRPPKSSAASAASMQPTTAADAEATDQDGDHIIPFDQAMAELEDPQTHTSASASSPTPSKSPLAHDPASHVTSTDDAEEDDDFM